MAGIQAQAGVLTLAPPAVFQDQQLTKKAKQRFVDDVIAELSALGAGLPCGPSVQAVDSATLQRLHDENQFPEFHANWLGDQGAYTKIARALDIKGTFLAPPFIDPFALFNIPGIPDFPPTLEFKTPDVLLDFIKPYIDISFPDVNAKFPPKIGPLPFPIPIPTFDIDPRFTALIELNLKLAKFVIEVALPNLVADLAVKIPQIAANIDVELPKLACGALNGIVSGDPRFLTQLVAVKVLANKLAECIEFDGVGLVLGCPDPDIAGGPGFGLVGALATAKGLGVHADEEKVTKEIELKKQEAITDEQKLRDSAVALMKGNVPAGFDVSSDPGQSKFQDITNLSIQQLKGKDLFISTCGFLPHWMLYRLGCRQTEIVNRDVPDAGLKYEAEANLGKLRLGAKKLGAWVPYSVNAKPKRGDIVLIQNDAAVNGDPILKQSAGTNVGTTPADYTSQHVFVFIEETDTSTATEKKFVWESADAGQGGVGTQSAKFVFRERKGRKLGIPGGLTRDINGWVDISKLKFTAAPIT